MVSSFAMNQAQSRRDKILRHVKRDQGILQLLGATFTKLDRTRFAQAVFPLLNPAGLSEDAIEDYENNFFALFCSWCGDDKGVPSEIKAVIAERSEEAKRRAKAKRKFIAEAGLHPSTPRTADSLRRHDVDPLPDFYPPVGKHVAETEDIRRKWAAYFERGRQPDGRLTRRPVHRLNPDHIQLVVPADESCEIYDKSTGELVGVVIRDFCPVPEVVDWAEEILEQGVGWKRSVRASLLFWLDFCRLLIPLPAARGSWLARSDGLHGRCSGPPLFWVG